MAFGSTNAAVGPIDAVDVILVAPVAPTLCTSSSGTSNLELVTSIACCSQLGVTILGELRHSFGDGTYCQNENEKIYVLDPVCLFPRKEDINLIFKMPGKWSLTQLSLVSLLVMLTCIFRTVLPLSHLSEHHLVKVAEINIDSTRTKHFQTILKNPQLQICFNLTYKSIE